MVFYNINTVPVDKDTFDGTVKFCDDNALANRRRNKSTCGEWGRGRGVINVGWNDEASIC